MNKIIYINSLEGVKTEFAKIPNSMSFMDWVIANQKKVFDAIGHFYDNEEPKLDTIEGILEFLRTEIISCIDTASSPGYFGQLKELLDYYMEERDERGYTHGYIDLHSSRSQCYREDATEFKIKQKGAWLSIS